MHIGLAILLGSAFAAVFVIFARTQSSAEIRTLAIGLLIAALIYVGFAVAGRAPISWLLAEVFGVFLFGAAAWLGIKHSPYWLVVGWIAHVAWDAPLHLTTFGETFTPAWYVFACIGFDFMVAIYILATSRAALSHV